MNKLNEWRNRADIPNLVGFKLTVLLKDGTEIKTVVNKNAKGLHHLTDVIFVNVIGWKPRN